MPPQVGSLLVQDPQSPQSLHRAVPARPLHFKHFPTPTPAPASGSGHQAAAAHYPQFRRPTARMAAKLGAKKAVPAAAPEVQTRPHPPARSPSRSILHRPRKRSIRLQLSGATHTREPGPKIRANPRPLPPHLQQYHLETHSTAFKALDLRSRERILPQENYMLAKLDKGLILVTPKP